MSDHEERRISRRAPTGTLGIAKPNPVRPYVWGYSIGGAALVTGIGFLAAYITAQVQQWYWLLGWVNWWAWTLTTVVFLVIDKERYERRWWRIAADEWPWRYRDGVERAERENAS